MDGIETYSTLGWFQDPLLNTFINEPDSYLAEIIFHELAHQRLFVPGDTDFNEAFATAVPPRACAAGFWPPPRPGLRPLPRRPGQGARNLSTSSWPPAANCRPSMTTQNCPTPPNSPRKQEIIAQLRAQHAELKATWGGKSPFDDWFAEPINNAKLNTISAYYDLVPAFDALLRANGGDMEKFYQAVARLGKLPIPSATGNSSPIGNGGGFGARELAPACKSGGKPPHSTGFR